ncbi:MAG: class I SAM-dependent methyltransferase [Alphaproteobacteria bacterium]
MAASNRLERMIDRLNAQRNCLALAIELTTGLPGPVIEFGLGKGRTYDFLRTRLPERAIFVFDREIHCPADCLPPPERLLLGDFRDTVPDALARIGEPAALLHFDVGSGDLEADAALVAWLAPAAAPLARRGAVVVADRAMTVAGWRELALDPGTGDGAHFVYRVER